MAKRFASGVWNFYDVDCADESIANCNIPVCSVKTKDTTRYSWRVKKPFPTKSLWSHLESYHPMEYKEAMIIRKADEAKRCKNDEEKSKLQSMYVLATQRFPNSIESRRTFELKNKRLSDHPDQISGTYLLAEWICDSLLPYTTVENKRFNVFVNNLNHKFDVPSENVLRKGLFRIFTDVYNTNSWNCFIII